MNDVLRTLQAYLSRETHFEGTQFAGIKYPANSTLLSAPISTRVVRILIRHGYDQIRCALLKAINHRSPHAPTQRNYQWTLTLDVNTSISYYSSEFEKRAFHRRNPIPSVSPLLSKEIVSSNPTSALTKETCRRTIKRASNILH